MSSAIESQNKPIRGRGRVISNEPDGRGRVLRLAIAQWPGSIPGQFMMINPGAEAGVERRDPLLPRPMAVYRDLGVSPDDVASEDRGEHQIELLYRVVGRGTTLLSEAGPGDSIRFVGPLGLGFPIKTSVGDAILVGGGTGIASLYELAKAFVAERRAVVVILGARSALDLIGQRDFEKLDVDLICTTEDGSHGIHGRVTEPLADRLDALAGEATVYAVGPTPMMRACARLADAKSASCYVSLENPMACGFGVCLGCAAPRREGGFSLVCRAGPVFDAQEIDWEGLA